MRIELLTTPGEDIVHQADTFWKAIDFFKTPFRTKKTFTWQQWIFPGTHWSLEDHYVLRPHFFTSVWNWYPVIRKHEPTIQKNKTKQTKQTINKQKSWQEPRRHCKFWWHISNIVFFKSRHYSVYFYSSRHPGVFFYNKKNLHRQSKILSLFFRRKSLWLRG